MGAGHDTLFGGSGHDFILGGNGDDQIHGGTGNDHLWGAGGINTSSFSNKDVFVWERGDAGATGAHDAVWDFDPDQGMKLDISNLLEFHEPGSTSTLGKWITSISTENAPAVSKMTGQGAPSGFADQLLSSTASTTKLTMLRIDVDGANPGTVTQTIWLRNWTPSTTSLDVWVDNGWLVV